ncbi:hypothetical protein Mapa_006059 [Marchantia paleacea]|nr:hypothetical protein Mapa_006059 [Marchantia paleacea]
MTLRPSTHVGRDLTYFYARISRLCGLGFNTYRQVKIRTKFESQQHDSSWCNMVK